MQPTTVEGIEKYLGSSVIRGIGPVYAKKLDAAFRKQVFNIIGAEPNWLQELTGIGKAGRRHHRGMGGATRHPRDLDLPAQP